MKLHTTKKGWSKTNNVKKASNKMSKAKKTQNSPVIQANSPSLILQEVVSTDPDTLPFAEWNDQDLKNEKFDLSPTKDKKVNEFLTQPPDYFVDPQDVKLPNNFRVQEWKRPSELFPKAHFVVFVNKPTYPELVNSNTGPLLTSEFVKSFICAVHTLLYLGNEGPFPVEYVTSNCAPPEKSWKPWHHIYSSSQVPKGQEHTPAISNSGKYLVRLFWLGSWKKIYVDDTLPVNKNDQLLLPTLPIPEFPKSETKLDVSVNTTPKSGKSDKSAKTPKSPKSKKGEKKDIKVIELWPMILSKALLKLASLSSFCDREMCDFDIIQCFTGWMPQKISTKDLELSDIWEISSGYCNNFRWPNDGDTKDKSSKNKKSKESKKGKNIALAKLDEDTMGHPVVAICDEITDDEIRDMSPCLSHGFLIHQTRDIPLVKPPPEPEIDFWKIDRWVPWAREKGILPPEVIPSKNFKIISPLLKTTDGTKLLNENTDLNIELNTEEPVKEKKEPKGKKSKGKHEIKLEPDPSFWIEYQYVADHIKSLVIYLAPSRFKSRAKITDISFEKSAPNKLIFKNINFPLHLKEFRNEPLYFFSDSLDYKLVLINISQVGYVDNLKKDDDIFESESKEQKNMDLDFCDEILLKYLKQFESQSSNESIISNKLSCDDQRSHTTLIFDKYTWFSNSFEENEITIKSYGNKSVLFEIKPGRNSYRIYFDTKKSFVVQILSDTNFDVGYLEEYLNNMSLESQKMTNLCFEISTNFGNLVQSFGLKNNYESCLKIFYQCYKPALKKASKKECNLINEVFYEKLYKIICELYNSNEYIECLNTLLLKIKTFDDINIYKYLDEEPHVNDKICTDQNCLIFIKNMHRSATIIQAFFKGIYVRSILKKHDENNKNYMQIFEKNKKIYSDIFSSGKRLTFVPNILRTFYEDSRLENVINKYDIDDVLAIKKYSGSVEFEKKNWAPICRYKFFVDSLKSIYIKISLFCDLKYYIRVFNNDNYEEIKRYTNNVAVAKYDSNLNGYTIFCYGMCNYDSKKNYKLIISTPKSFKDTILVTSENKTKISLFKDNYLPNFKNVLFRYFLKINMSPIYLTLRLYTTYEDSVICLKIINPQGKKMQEIKGKGSVILPLTKLEIPDSKNKGSDKRLPRIYSRKSSIKSLDNRSLHSNRSSKGSSHKRSLSISSESQLISQVIYVLEGHIEPDTWPLNCSEWKTVQDSRQNKLIGPDLNINKPTDISYKNIQTPYWSLHIIYELEDVLDITKDTSQDEQFKNEKLQWYENDIHRYYKSSELRTKYIEENSIPKSDTDIVESDDIRDIEPNFCKECLRLPDFEAMYTKPLDETDLDERYVKKEADFIEEENADLEKQREFDEYQNDFFEKMAVILTEQKENFELWHNWFEEIKSESVEMINNANKLKTKYINDVLEELEKEKKSKKGGKKDKDKEKAKGKKK